MTKQSKCSSTYQTNRKPHNRTVTNHTPPLIKETKCTKPLTNFFVRFEDNIKVSTNLQPNQSKRLSSSISEKFSQLCKNSFSNKHPLKNLLNFNLEDNSIKPLGKNKQLVKDFYNLPIDETLEENNAYYANNCDPKLASVSPGVNYLIDQISKLNEHHVNTSRFTFYENKLKMIGMIYSKLRTNASISDSLALCPSQSSFSILKQAEILDKIEQKKVSSSNPMPCTTLTEAIQFTDAPNVQGYFTWILIIWWRWYFCRPLLYFNVEPYILPQATLVSQLSIYSETTSVIVTLAFRSTRNSSARSWTIKITIFSLKTVQSLII